MNLPATIERIECPGRVLYLKGYHSICASEFTPDELRAIAEDVERKENPAEKTES